jgi:replicative DNA helicase
MLDTASERAVLAGICQYGLDGYLETAGALDVESFTSDMNQAVWKVGEYIYLEGKEINLDIPTILSTAKTLKIYDLVNDNIPYVKTLFNFHIEKNNLKPHVKRIANCKLMRDLDKQVDLSKYNLSQLDSTASIDEILGAVEDPILTYTNGLNEEEESSLMGDGALEFMQHLANEPRDMIGISSGYPVYDELIGGGFQRGDINFIAARMKRGKSTLADNISLHVSSKLKIPVLQIDTEMKKTRHQIRIISRMTKVPMKEIKTGIYGQDPRKKELVERAAKALKGFDFHYKNIAGMEFKDALGYIRRWIMKTVGVDPETGKTRDCLIVWDYLKILDQKALGKIGEHQAIGFQLQEIIGLVIKYDVACLCFAQQNRSGEDEDNTAASVAMSDRIGMYCGSLALFQNKAPAEVAEDGPLQGNKKMRVVLARDGEGIQDDNEWINMKLHGAINHIKELGLRSQAKNEPEQQSGDLIPF